MGNHFKNHLIPEGCEVHAVIDRNGFRLFARIEGMESELPIECKDRLFMDCIRRSFKTAAMFSQEINPVFNAPGIGKVDDSYRSCGDHHRRSVELPEDSGLDFYFEYEPTTKEPEETK